MSACPLIRNRPSQYPTPTPAHTNTARPRSRASFADYVNLPSKTLY